jgi:hypothetical protein
MQPDSPYRLIEALGSSQVGSVWSAVDAEGRPLTVALLDASVALDQQWRDAFAAAANALAQPQAGGPRVLYTDFAAPSPWVACAGEGGPGAEQVFLTLGVTYQPMPPDLGGSDAPAAPVPHAAVEETTSSPDTPVEGEPSTGEVDGEITQPTQKIELDSMTPVNPWAAPPQPVAAPPHQPISTPPHAVSGPPQSVSAPPDSVSGAPHAILGPVSGAPHAVSGPPQHMSVPPHVVSSVPQSPTPMQFSPAYGQPPSSGPSQYPAYYPPQAAPPAASPARPRTGLWVGIGALVLFLIVGGGTALALRGSGGDDPPSNPTTAAPPTTAAMFPGIEPPRVGSWPAHWPTFAATEQVQSLDDLEGLGFPIKVPQGWACTPGGQSEGYARYLCGMPPGENPRIGGEIIVRNCPAPCAPETQTAMRRAEEAWGLQWIQVGESATYAELGGTQRYGLVVVAYWRSGSNGDPDRQLVVRMTGPLADADDLHKVVTNLRDTLNF